MIQKSFRDIQGQAVALAGIIQAAQVVDTISQQGDYSNDQLMPLINGLFEFNPMSAMEVFGGPKAVRPGLEQLLETLNQGRLSKKQDIIRYFFGMLFLGKNLSNNPEMLSIISSRLEHTALKKAYFTSNLSDICSSLSAIYQDTLSSFNFRIHVAGNLTYLQNEKNSDMIRATLFAGIRASILWRQCGGRRWKMIFQRGKIILATRELLDTF